MKKGIHPKYGPMTIIDTKGNKFTINSCLTGKEQTLQADHYTHRAWTKQKRNLINAGNVQKLEKKFKGFNDL